MDLDEAPSTVRDIHSGPAGQRVFPAQMLAGALLGRLSFDDQASREGLQRRLTES